MIRIDIFCVFFYAGSFHFTIKGSDGRNGSRGINGDKGVKGTHVSGLA